MNPNSRPFRREGPGKEVNMTYLAHTLTETPDGFIVDNKVTTSGTKQEWDTGVSMLPSQNNHPGQTTSADKSYEKSDFLIGCCRFGATPYFAATKARSATERRTTVSARCVVSQQKRVRVEEFFGWMESYGLMHKLRNW